MFEYLVARGVGPLHRNRFNSCAVEAAMVGPDPELRDYVVKSGLLSQLSPGTTNPLAGVHVLRNPGLLKRVYNSLPPTTAQVLLDLETADGPSPLCIAARSNFPRTTSLLPDLQANIEHEGSSFGTPLMCAATCGRLYIVKLLVRRGAKLEYTDEEGTYKSALLAGLQHPKVREWLLVGRFQDQKKLTSSSAW